MTQIMIMISKSAHVLAVGSLLMLNISCSSDSIMTGIIKKPKVQGITIDDTTSILIYGRRFDSLKSGNLESPIASAILANSTGKGIDGGEVITYDTLDKRTVVDIQHTVIGDHLH